MISHASDIPRDLRRYVELDWYLGMNVKPTSLSPPATVTNILFEDSLEPLTFAVCLEPVALPDARSVSQKGLVKVKNYVMNDGEFLWRVTDVPKMIWLTFKELNLQKADSFPDMVEYKTPNDSKGFRVPFSQQMQCLVLGQTAWKIETDGSVFRTHFKNGAVLKFSSNELVISIEGQSHVLPLTGQRHKPVASAGTMSIRDGVKHFEIYDATAFDLNEIESE